MMKRLEYIDYSVFRDYMEQLKKSNTQYITVHNVFDIFPNIQPPNCISENNQKCKNYQISISEGSGKDLPTVFLLAGIHGNEIIGTNAMFYLIKMFENPTEELLRLIQNVRLLILPMVNVNGFDSVKRTENINNKNYDPNRDFPYNQKGNVCLQTSTAQIIDQVFRNNIIIGTLTFHGGSTSITYPWGNFAHKKDPQTAEQEAYQKIADILKIGAGSNKNLGVNPYQTGDMQDVVYDVYGGYEDWAYGASWDVNNVPKFCELNGKQIKTQYEDFSNRAMTYLVEAGDKLPGKKTGGNEQDIFNTKSKGSINGNISRNIRLSILFSQMMNPYVSIKEIKQEEDFVATLVIYGVMSLDNIKVKNYKSTYEVLQYDSNYNQYTVNLFIAGIITDQIDINIQFDSKIKEKQFQSHYMRMRVDEGYYVEHDKFTVNSIKNKKISIHDIRGVEANKAKLFYNFGNQIQMIYKQQSKLFLNKNNDIYFNFHNDQIQFKDNNDYFVKIKNQLFDIKNYNFQQYIELLGRQIVIKKNNKIIKKDIIVSDEFLLLIPKEGLQIQFQELKIENFDCFIFYERNKFYLKIISMKKLKIEFKIYSKEFQLDLKFNDKTQLFEDQLEIKQQRLRNYRMILKIQNTSFNIYWKVKDNKIKFIFKQKLNFYNFQYLILFALIVIIVLLFMKRNAKRQKFIKLNNSKIINQIESLLILSYIVYLYLYHLNIFSLLFLQIFDLNSFIKLISKYLFQHSQLFHSIDFI